LDRKIIDKCQLKNDGYHSDELIYQLEIFLGKNNLCYSDIDVLSLTKGPGNFTMLKVLMTFAKGFKSCFPNIPIVTNNLFEILASSEEYDIILLDVSEKVVYVFDKKRYFFIDKDNITDILQKDDKIITNSFFLLDLLKNNFKVKVKNFEEDCILNMNYKKVIDKDFDEVLEPLYVREPAINLKK
jgi:tRNA A37 threonylcarbamoyladenosine modification protein TsaB